MRSGPHTATLKFSGTLADFISDREKGPPIRQVNFRLHPSAKDLIESQGVPHVEIYALQVNNRFQPLEYNVQNGDQLVVYPKREAELLTEEKRFKNPKQLPHSFIADVHLGKLARQLRLLGIDTKTADQLRDPEIIEISKEENRAVLTRDLELLKHGELQEGYWIRATDPERQTREVLDYFNLEDKIHPFTRCMNCNGLLESVEKNTIGDQIPNKVKQWCDEFRQCTKCKQIYWKGSHYEKLLKKVEQILAK